MIPFAGLPAPARPWAHVATAQTSASCSSRDNTWSGSLNADQISRLLLCYEWSGRTERILLLWRHHRIVAILSCGDAIIMLATALSWLLHASVYDIAGDGSMLERYMDA